MWENAVDFSKWAGHMVNSPKMSLMLILKQIFIYHMQGPSFVTPILWRNSDSLIGKIWLSHQYFRSICLKQGNTKQRRRSIRRYLVTYQISQLGLGLPNQTRYWYIEWSIDLLDCKSLLPTSNGHTTIALDLGTTSSVLWNFHFASAEPTNPSLLKMHLCSSNLDRQREETTYMFYVFRFKVFS